MMLFLPRGISSRSEVEVAKDRESKGAGDGSCRHREEVRHDVFFARELGSLGRAEAMLFVDHDICEMLEADGFLYKRVGADEDRNLAVRDPLEELGPRYVRPSSGIYF